MAKSSIHFSACNAEFSELHNTRKIKPSYVLRGSLEKNENWTSCSIAEAREQAINFRQNIVDDERKNGKNSRGLRSDAKLIREAVINLNKDHDMSDLQNLKSRLEAKFGLEIFQMYIHRDEGKSHDEKNYHAHILAKWTNPKTGKVSRFDREDLRSMQDITAEVLQMERGVSGGQRLEHKEFRKLANQLEQAKKKTIGEKLTRLFVSSKPLTELTNSLIGLIQKLSRLETEHGKLTTRLNKLKVNPDAELSLMERIEKHARGKQNTGQFTGQLSRKKKVAAKQKKRGRGIYKKAMQCTAFNLSNLTISQRRIWSSPHRCPNIHFFFEWQSINPKLWGFGGKAPDQTLCHCFTCCSLYRPNRLLNCYSSLAPA